MNSEVKEIIVDLMSRLYEAQGFNEMRHYSAADRNIFEAEMKDTYDKLDELIGACDEATAQDYEDEIESLEDSLKEQKEEYDALMIKYEDLEEDYKDLEKTLDRIKEAIWS